MGGFTSKPITPDEALVARYLTAQDKTLLMNCWTDIERKDGVDKFATDMGKVVFCNLFNKFPHVLQMFDHFKEDPNWVGNRRFLHHCKIFITIIGSYIKLLNRPEELTHHVKFLGNQHLFFRINRAHFSLAKVEFADAVAQSFPPEVLTPELRHAWLQLFDLLSEIMLNAMGTLADLVDEDQPHAP